MAQFRFIGDPRSNGDGPSPQEIYGLTFSRDEWTDVPSELVEKAARHSHLERRSEKAKEIKPVQPGEDAVAARGASAKAAGKARTVPPAYRSKPEEARWLTGYDGGEA